MGFEVEAEWKLRGRHTKCPLSLGREAPGEKKNKYFGREREREEREDGGVWLLFELPTDWAATGRRAFTMWRE